MSEAILTQVLEELNIKELAEALDGTDLSTRPAPYQTEALKDINKSWKPNRKNSLWSS